MGVHEDGLGLGLAALSGCCCKDHEQGSSSLTRRLGGVLLRNATWKVDAGGTNALTPRKAMNTIPRV